MVKYDCERKSTYDVLNHSNGCDDYYNNTENDDKYGLDALSNVQEFFASYDGAENPLEWSSLALEEEEEGEAEEANEEAEEEANEEAEEEDDFEKL
jgi:hypothetical protein